MYDDTCQGQHTIGKSLLEHDLSKEQRQGACQYRNYV